MLKAETTSTGESAWQEEDKSEENAPATASQPEGSQPHGRLRVSDLRQRYDSALKGRDGAVAANDSVHEDQELLSRIRTQTQAAGGHAGPKSDVGAKFRSWKTHADMESFTAKVGARAVVSFLAGPSARTGACPKLSGKNCRKLGRSRRRRMRCLPAGVAILALSTQLDSSHAHRNADRISSPHHSLFLCVPRGMSDSPCTLR
eukprot:Polyplicarium_translucidae@DN177_c0_g1_i1.p1